MVSAHLLRMPKLGLTMEAGVVASWEVGEGDRFAEGQPLLVVETDKIANEVAAPAAGRLRRILAQPGDSLPVGEPLAEWDPDERSATTADAAAAFSPRVIATPLARRLARQAGIDLRDVRGSGPRGRIKACDLPRSSPPAPPPTTIERHAGTAPTPRVGARSTREHLVAQRMVAAKRDIPHFYLAAEVDVSALETLRQQLKAEGHGLSLTHLVLAAMARALAADPGANRVWRGEAAVHLDSVDIGLAVDTPGGLVAPILQDLGKADLWTIAARANALIDRARNNALVEADLAGSPMMTLSNAGMHDVTWMTAIIPPGQAAILGAGSVRAVFRPDPAGRPVLCRELGLVLSCDHRVFDGVSGLALLNRIRSVLQRPVGLLVPPKEG